MPGSTNKICTSCQATIGVASKICKACGGKQPYKILKQKRLERAKQRIVQSPHGLKANAVKLKDAAYVHLHNLHAAGYVPLLLLGKKKGSKVTAELLTLSENPSPQERITYKAIESVFESFLNVYFDGTTCVTTTQPAPSPPVYTQPVPLQSSTTSFNCTAFSNPSPTSVESTHPASTSDLLSSPSTSSAPKEKGKEAIPEVAALRIEAQGPDSSVSDGLDVLMVPDITGVLDPQPIVQFDDISLVSLFSPSVPFVSQPSCPGESNRRNDQREQELDSLAAWTPPGEDPAEMNRSIHQVPVCPLDLEPTYPFSEDDAHKLIYQCRDLWSMKDVSMEVPSLNMEEDSSLLQHFYSTSLDLTETERGRTLDSHTHSDSVFEVPSAHTQGFEDS
ncbi:uncharacterized protein LOC108443827 [Pygocentrus nattereri]|uniref:uncharacterized protein LOC108443827 n=1 Tax=Pygocentrus nattereri TaxID=42514 RepID=UPI0008145DCC|nr:uncharacterized protein LOC108443827 [Pygocentrus nattereri]XP_017580181.1 uncharacterized protein LOC108443827 [Pygocentrus nattereri]XP_017580182.1 uncharacterized protein LOC108443827 [Pygocentrus nattereri]